MIGITRRLAEFAANLKPRIQLVSATPYGSETTGFSTKYKTAVRIST